MLTRKLTEQFNGKLTGELSSELTGKLTGYITEQLTRDFTGEFAVIFNLKLVVVLIPGGEGLQLHAVLPGLHGGCSSRGSS